MSTAEPEERPAGVPPGPEDELEERVLPGAGLSVRQRMELEAAVPPLKPRVREIVDVARGILDEEGVDGLSMRAIAARLGVRAPSLYKHLPDKQAIVDVLVADILHEWGDIQRRALREADDPVGTIFACFRDWALEHPERYALAMGGPLTASPLVRSADLYGADPLRWVMREDLEGAIVFWAFAHGLVDLEMKGRIPAAYDPEPLWAWGVGRLRHPRDGDPPPLIGAGRRAAQDFRAGLPEPVGLTPRAARIAAVARELLEEEGEEGMSMRRIAARLGVRAPSLYKHLPDKAALENAIIASILDDQARISGEVADAARAAGEDPLQAIVTAFRDWALVHPALYRLNMRGPLDDGALVRTAEIRSAGPLLQACEGHGHAAMSVWAFAHGIVDLELKGRVPPGYELDAIRRRGVEALRPSA